VDVFSEVDIHGEARPEFELYEQGTDGAVSRTLEEIEQLLMYGDWLRANQ